MKFLFKNKKNHPIYGRLGALSPGYIDGRSSKKYYCIKCGNIVSSFLYKRCRSCSAKKRLINPKNNPAYKHGKTLVKSYCINCGKLLHKQAFLYGNKKCLYCSLLDKNMRQKVFDTNIELQFKNELLKRNIEFKHPYRIKNHPADFYIPKYNLVIECDGEYWHNKPSAKEKDTKHNIMMRNNGYYVKRLKGSNILNKKINYDKIFAKYKQLNKEKNNE
jgi:very-short-patch-repair endonuclease/DNA-directed RNA polymerase subunit RPC12/RpoP